MNVQFPVMTFSSLLFQFTTTSTQVTSTLPTCLSLCGTIQSSTPGPNCVECNETLINSSTIQVILSVSGDLFLISVKQTRASFFGPNYLVSTKKISTLN